MTTLQITCLGDFQVTIAGTPVMTFRTEKDRALLVYLAVEQRPHQRTELAQFLWPGYSEGSARNSLRQSLHHLRQLLPDLEPALPWLLITRQTVQINPAATIQIDVTAFSSLLKACATHAHEQLSVCQPCLARLQQTVDLYHGDFLAGFTVADSDPFEEWRRIRQEQLHMQMLDTLAHLATAAEQVGDEEGALWAAQRQLALEPWLEVAHRRIMRILARCGQRAAAIAQYNRCCQVLAEELGATPEAESRALYEQIQSGVFDKMAKRVDGTTRVEARQPVIESSSHVSPPLMSNLPVFPTPLVGRAQAIAEISATLQRSEARLLTLVGPGGMGKTRLAVEVGTSVYQARLDTCADGVFFVPLAPISGALPSADALASAIANALGITLQGSEPQNTLCQLLGPKQLLLILDNFEHLLGGSSASPGDSTLYSTTALVAALLNAAPGIQIIVTSRERLKLREEQIYAVPPLTFSTSATLAEARAVAAVRLFVQSVQRIQSDFQLTASNLPAVLRICHAVQGMPLGLELAAANTRVAPLTAIAAAIEQSAEVLHVDWEDRPERQRSMRAVFAWSWQLLNAEEQQILCQSAVFRGGFTYAAVQAVTGATLPRLTSLVDKSLLQWQATATGAGRYAFHELLRQFAAEYLAAMTAEQEKVAARHSEFYLNYLAAREMRLTRAEPRAAVAEIQTELDNIRQAWQYAVQRQAFSALQRSAWTLFSFYRHTGALAEARQAFQAIVDQIPLSNQPAQTFPPQGRLIAIYAYLLVFQNKFDQAVIVAQQALALAQAEEDTAAAALSQLSWGQALRQQGRRVDAQFHLEQALQLARLAPTSSKSDLLYDVECLAEIWLGATHIDLGFYQKAKEPMRRSLQLAQTLGKRRMEMTALVNLADLARLEGAYVAARQEYEAALRLAREVGYRWGEGVSQYELGHVLRMQGEYSSAVACIENTLPIFQEIGEHSRKASALIALGKLYAYLGDTTTAERWLTRYQHFIEQLKDWEETIHFLEVRTVLAFNRGEPAQALAYATAGWQCGQTSNPPEVEAYALIGIGHAQRELGAWPAAATAYQQAIDLYTAIQRPDLAAEAQAGLAALAQQQGDHQRAQQLVETVLAQLAAQPISGQDEPFFLYLTCYQVLAAAQDPRAPAIVQQGYALLQHYVEQITEEQLRQSFLENVPVHRALQQAYRELQTNRGAMLPLQDSGQHDQALPVGASSDKAVNDKTNPSPFFDWTEMPAVDFWIERTDEVAQVTSWLTDTAAGGAPAQLISLLGMGGMGKTTLAAAVTKAVAPSFAVVIWRSLLNAPPLSQLLCNWLQLLSRQTLTTLPESLDEQLRLLLAYLQQERCLLVLDNVESIFTPAMPVPEEAPHLQSRAGVTRPGYEDYDQLLQWLATREHQSCLLLTSREQPYTLARLGRQAQFTTGRVRLLTLAGLDQQAGHALLESNGLHASTSETAKLVENYSGNPLALQIVAATIVDFFGGNVAAFQCEEGSLFDGMRLVLDQQFARLSGLEREILVWLAIEREAITVPTLRSNFVQSVVSAPLIEALQALQNRSLLAKRESGFTLQNVIIEYTTEYLVEQVCEEILALRGWVLDSPVERPPSIIQNSFLNRFALLKAQAKDYVRQSQMRLIVQPLAERLVQKLGRAQVVERIHYLFDVLRAAEVRTGYAAGNLLNLLVHLGANLTNIDCSHLAVWQADLRGVILAAANFTGADLAYTAFTADINVGKIKFRPSGELLIGSIRDGDLCLWQTIDGQLTDARRWTNNNHLPLHFSNDGNWLVVASADYMIQVWSTEMGVCMQTLTGHRSAIHAIAMSADGTHLASGSADGLVYLWEWRSGQVRQRLSGYKLGVGSLAFSPDGKTLATGSGDGLIRLWETQSPESNGQLLATLQAHNHDVGALAFSPDGRWLASGGHGGNIRLWDLQSQGMPALRLQGHTSIIRDLCFQPAGSTSAPSATYLLASASADQTVRLWSLTGELRYTMLGHTNDILALAFSADGRQLASSGEDQTIYWWDTRTGQIINSLQAYRHGPTTIVRFTPDGELAVSGSADQLVRLWPVGASATAEPITERTPCYVLRGHTHFVRAVAVSPGGQIIASGGADHTIRLWDRTTQTELGTLTGHTGSVLSLAFTRTASNGVLLASASADHSIRLWSLTEFPLWTDRRHRLLLGHEEEILTLAFDPTGRWLISGGMNGSVWIWDVESGVPQRRLTGHTAAVTMVAISPDGSTLATSAFDQTLRLWDLQTGHCLQVKKDEHVGTRAVVFGGQPGTANEFLAYDGDDFAIYLWPWRTGAPAYALRGHSHVVIGLDVSPTAPLLASLSRDGTLRIWDLETRSCRQILRAPGPYAGMQITGVTGVSEAQKAALRALGAEET